MSIGLRIAIALAVFLSVVLVVLTFEHPPMKSVQNGFRGLGMQQVQNPAAVAAQQAANRAPAAQPAAAPGSPPVSTVFKNVQVLGDLNVGEFTRLMVAITEWVSPKEGCNYCHAGADLASDAPYTKVVARRMLQMTRDINGGAWKNHVGDTGVTCFTCHRGQPVPPNIWFTAPAPRSAKGAAGAHAGQNAPAVSVGLTSLPYDPFTPFLGKAGAIRVQSSTALPAGNPHNIMETEWTYGLMMHMSDGLGVNCTFCHNTRSFFAWDASTPQRTTAYHGIQMARALNGKYLEPLKAAYPPNRLGPLGDAPKVNCATCHQGVSKPLLGAAMLKDYPELRGGAAKPAAAAATAPEPVVIGEVVIVYFAVDSAALHDQTPKVLEVVVAKLRANTAAKATVSGYHSATGDATRNHDLARSRAHAVRDALKAAGIAEDRVVLEKPAIEQANIVGEDPRARRVEVTVK
jgi:photosynthetic reaction center cytochrome c subunit